MKRWWLSEKQQSQRISSEIDKQLKKQNKEHKPELKLLLLGTGESGKSTFIKQMRIIHGQGYSESERKGFTMLVYQNIITNIQTLIYEMKTLKIDYADYQNIRHAEKLSQVELINLTYLESWQMDAIKRVWNDHGVQKCYERRREYQLSDSAKYYLSDLDRITAPGYIPTHQDLLRIRHPTTGIIEYIFEMSKVIFRMIDVGGLRSERKKWIHVFENVTSIIFLAALSEYDQVLRERETDNRMSESLALFGTIISTEWLQAASIILFLNKTDQLKEKVGRSHFANYFQDYKGPQGDAEAVKQFIEKMYVQLHCGHRQPLYTHFTCTTDTENIRVVFKAIRPIIIYNSLNTFSLE